MLTGGKWGEAHCLNCGFSLGARITCPHCGYINSVEKTAESIHDCGGAQHHRYADHIADAGKVIAQPVKQEPVAFVSDVHLSRYTLEWNGQPLPEGTKLYAAPVQPVKQDPVAYFLDVKAGCSSKPFYEQVPDEYKNDADVFPLYAAPVSVEAIRAEALEEAAKWCEAKQSYSAMHANTEFAAGIRGLK